MLLNRASKCRVVVLRRCLFVCLLFLISPFTLASGSIQKISQADFLHSGSLSIPDAQDSGWIAVQLPDMWRQAQHQNLPPQGWYRLNLGAKPDNPDQAISITRTLMTADYYFNGTKIGRTGQLDSMNSRYWNTPSMFRIPSALWQSADNELLIRLAGPPGFIMLVPLELGPYDLLKPLFERKQFLQNVLPGLFVPALFAISAFFFVLWLQQRDESQYLWFSLAASFWAVYNINLAIADFPFSTRLWQLIAHSCTDWFMVSMAFFANRLVGNKRPRQDRLYFSFCLFSFFTYWLAPQSWIAVVPVILHGLGLLIYINGSIELFRYARIQKNSQFALMGFGLLCSLLLGIWDLYMSTRPAAVVDTVIFIGAIAVPIVFAGISWRLTSHFVAALKESKTLNIELESRVARASAALEEIYTAQSALEKEQAVVEERDRIYRDLHDDMGAKLLNLVYKTDGSEISEIARSALQDLRDVVTRSASNELKLPELLADWHVEAEQRVATHEISLLWDQSDVLDQRIISSTWAVNLGRIIREAISNIIKHAEADVITVAIFLQNDHLHVRVDDNGKGMPEEPGRYARGMNNMRRRASQLDGQIEWCETDGGGCSVQFFAPLNVTA